MPIVINVRCMASAVRVASLRRYSATSAGSERGQREQRQQLRARSVRLRMAPEAHDLEQLLHGLAKPALAREHAGELEANVVVERIDGELLAQLGFAWAAGAGLRELKALLERRDAIGDRDVARYLREQLDRFGGLAGGECRLGRLQRFLARGRHELREELAHLRFGNRAHELRHGSAVFERDDVGDGADVERLRELWVLVGVDLHELHAAAECFERPCRAWGPACGRARTTAPRSRRRRVRISMLRRPRVRSWR